MLSNLIKRAVTGLFFVLVMVGGIIYSPISFFVLFALITLLTLREFYALINNHLNTSINIWLNAIVGTAFFCIFTLVQLEIVSFSYILLAPFLLYYCYIFVKELYNQKTEPLKNLAYTVLGQFYITIPFSLLSLLACLPLDGDTSYKWVPVVAIFIFIWMNDSGAYIVGSQLGKRRLFERISPNKSWEGFWGGLVFAVLSSVLFGYLVPVLSIPVWMGLALTVSVTGVFGDLTESMMKRILGVKDSGNILPGHGGLLDRFDAILFAIPAAIIYLSLFML